jgi:tol-pal system protein YbgF
MTRLRRAFLAALVMLAPSFALAQDAAELLVRVNRLESQLRQLSGQIEQLQFENRRLLDQLTKFQQDVEFRFQDVQGGKGGSAAPAQRAPAPAAPAQGAAPQRRSDVFDPSSQPDAPGAPRALGTTQPTPGGALAAAAGTTTIMVPDQDGPPRGGGPIDLSAVGRGVPSAPPSMPQGALQDAPSPPAAATASPPPAAQVAAIPPRKTPREEYEEAVGLAQMRRWSEAEMAFRSFLKSYPKDPNAPNATFQLGETYLRREQHADAAEQYLKIYQTWPKSAVAPEALYKLGLSLKGLKQKDQACGTFAEVGRRYPNAAPGLKATVDREMKRTGC